MKYLISLLIICLFLVSCECNYYEADSGELTDKQIEFAKQLLEAPAITETVWKNTKILELTFGHGVLADKEHDTEDILPLANLVAEEKAKDGFAYTGKDICVRILNPDKVELAYACMDYENF